MYTTCLHCQKSLGRNEAIESLPIGKRVAFDAAQGRLWVVCSQCERWNLTPFEERWEALEQCERAFRDTRVRQSTDNIGLARLPDGTDLVRVGRPLLPEFAAWRYGDQFGRRRVRAVAGGVAAAAGVGITAAVGLSVGVAFIAAVPLLSVLSITALLEAQRAHAAGSIRLPDGRVAAPNGPIRLIEMPSARDGWGIEAAWWPADGSGETVYVKISSDDAIPVLRRKLPQINGSGASRGDVANGVGLIESAGGPDQFGRWALTQRKRWSMQQTSGDSGDFNHIPRAARLAFEMALNEDVERRALDGELQHLYAQWQAAEEVARISDGLLPSPVVEERLKQLQRRHRN